MSTPTSTQLHLLFTRELSRQQAADENAKLAALGASLYLVVVGEEDVLMKQTDGRLAPVQVRRRRTHAKAEVHPGGSAGQPPVESS